MQRGTKDKAEEENLVKKKCTASAVFLNGEGQGVPANDTHVIDSNYHKRNHYVRASGKSRGKVLLP